MRKIYGPLFCDGQARQLEADYRQTNALLCDLTFWAVEFLWLAEGT